MTTPDKNGNIEYPCVDFCFLILLQTKIPLNWCPYVTSEAALAIESLYGLRRSPNEFIFATIGGRKFGERDKIQVLCKSTECRFYDNLNELNVGRNNFA